MKILEQVPSSKFIATFCFGSCNHFICGLSRQFPHLISVFRPRGTNNIVEFRIYLLLLEGKTTQ